MKKKKIAVREPTHRYEELQRRIKRSIQNFVGFILDEGSSLQLLSVYDAMFRGLRRLFFLTDAQILINIESYFFSRSLLTDCDKLKHYDGYENWRHMETKELSDLVQKKINFLRNPPSCDVKKLIIEKFPEENCEFACQVHFLVNSLSLAFIAQRAIALSNKSTWKFEEYFKPISVACEMEKLESNISWPGLNYRKFISDVLE